MFKNPRYLTRGVAAEIPVEVQLFLWLLIDSIEGQADYLQVFHLSPENGAQHIIHTQEVPPFRAEYDITLGRDESFVTASLFVIDDGDHTTMLLASEY